MRTLENLINGKWALTASAMVEVGDGDVDAEQWLSDSDLSAIINATQDAGLLLSIYEGSYCEYLTGEPRALFINGDTLLVRGNEIKPFCGEIKITSDELLEPFNRAFEVKQSHERFCLVTDDVDYHRTDNGKHYGVYPRYHHEGHVVSDFVELTNENTLIRTMNILVNSKENFDGDWLVNQRVMLIYTRTQLH